MVARRPALSPTDDGSRGRPCDGEGRLASRARERARCAGGGLRAERQDPSAVRLHERRLRSRRRSSPAGPRRAPGHDDRERRVAVTAARDQAGTGRPPRDPPRRSAGRRRGSPHAPEGPRDRDPRCGQVAVGVAHARRRWSVARAAGPTDIGSPCRGAGPSSGCPAGSETPHRGGRCRRDLIGVGGPAARRARDARVRSPARRDPRPREPGAPP